VIDLSDVLDLGEEGIRIQTATPLEAGSSVNLCLDLPETKAYVHTTGEVVWSESSGKAGIHFAELPEASAKKLREWLFWNLLVASASRADVKRGGDTGLETADSVEAAPAAETESIPGRDGEVVGPWSDSAPDYGRLQEELKRTVEYAQAFTGATGAALALSEGRELVCLASSGDDAPPVGSRLAVGSGFSGECVRSGQALICQDALEDSRVDSEACRFLGIRSILAVPIQIEGRGVGLLETLSNRPRAFQKGDALALQQLVEPMVPRIKGAYEKAGRKAVGWETSLKRDDTEARESFASSPGEPSTESHFAFQPAKFSLPEPEVSRASRVPWIAAATVAVIIFGWWLSRQEPVTGKRPPNGKSAKVSAATAANANSATAPPADTDPLEGLRASAQSGDARAQFTLGAKYATGEDVPQDFGEAAKWFEQAAEQGHVLAQSTLGAYYWVGRGVPADLKKAYFWSVLARAGGDEPSKYRMDGLRSRLSREDILQVQQQANQWLKEHLDPSTPQPASH
jgi:putative methionine-R-sulfoxide reductase with GAF domain